MKFRKGKMTTGGHSSTIPGLREFVRRFDAWPEVGTVKLGRIARCRHSSVRLTLRPTRFATVGEVRTGIVCEASVGAQMQVVIITSSDPQVLWARLATTTASNGATR